MKPLFFDVFEIRASVPLRALDKLVAAGVTVHSVEKCAAGCLKIRVKSKESKKIFAIFRGSCYTVKRIGSGGWKRRAERLLHRPALAIGLLAFFLTAAAGNLFVLRIDVVGSGARYREQSLQLLNEQGVHTFSLYDAQAAERAREQMLLLDDVVFVSLEKSGSVLTVTIEQSAQIPLPSRETELVSPCDGVVEELTALRGTPLAAEGAHVSAGDVLVGGWLETQAGERIDTFAVARASILCEGTFSYAASEDSDAARQRARMAAIFSCGGEPLECRLECAPQQQRGVLYTVQITYRVRVSVNLGEKADVRS